jgi:2-methylcitrate dehydratase
MWKACAFANAARNGLFAAMLAGQGMTGPAPIFEGEKGFMNLVSGSFDLPPFGGEHDTQEERAAFKILDTYIKQYPAEYHAQTAVEAALSLREDLLKSEGEQALAAITDVEIGSYDVAIEIIGRDPEKWHPRTRETADHSLPYCVAVSLMDGAVTRRSFDKKRLADAALSSLIHKIRVIRQPEFIGRYPQAMPTRVTVRTQSGKDYVKQVDYPLGHPRNPMPDHDVEKKFLGLAAGPVGRARARQMIDLVWQLDRVQDISTLMPLLRVKRKG